MSDVVSQLESAEWREFKLPKNLTVGIPLAVGAITFVTAASIAVIREKIKENRDRKVKLESRARNERRRNSDQQ